MFDVIIIGGGPAGITAGIYAKRSGLNVLILEKSNVGGQVINTYEIKNFPTYTNISGADFCELLYAQAKANDLEIKYEEVTSLDVTSNIKKVKTKFCEYEAKSIIFAAGTINRQLDLENEEKFCGRGISYCAICDGNFYKDKTVCVIGGGDTAMEEAVYLGGICKKVYVIYRKDKFRAQNVLQNSLFNHIKNKGNIEIIYNAEVVKLLGEKSLSQIEIKINNDNTKLLDVDGMFLAIGKIPDTQILSGQIALDKDGYIIVDGNLQTNVKGVYAAGDCRQKLIRQILTACSDGAICATNANKFLKGE
ncbi:MAG: thioredoxin-disulfide reductase [Christensenellales bacterium]